MNEKTPATAERLRNAGGRRRAPLPGLDPNTAALVALLQAWVNESGLTLDAIAHSFTPEQFGGRPAPRRSAIGERLRGKALDRDFVGAIVEVCTPNEQVQARRLKQALAVLKQVEDAQTPTGSATSDSSHALLVRNQQHTIDVQNKLMQAQDALLRSNQALAQSNQLVLMLLHMVNHLNEKYRELQRESDRLRFSASNLPTQEDVHRKLATTSNLLEKAREERARAEIEQQEALQLKDVALRRADALQHKLDRLRGEPQDASLPTPSEPTRWDPIPATQDPELDDIARALATASAVNDENEQLTQEARENLGLEPADDMLSALSVPAPDNADNRIPEAESGAAETIVGLGEPNLTLAELAASEAVFGQTPTGFILFDNRLRLQRVNNAFASGMALAPTDLEGLTPHDIFPETEADRLTAALRKVLASGEPVFDLRFHAAVPNRLWAVSLYRLNGAAGQPIGVAGQVSDVTSRHVAEREADGVRRNLALLNEASAHIGSTLDLETTAK
ncbi:PAS domain-containing protein, partial [Kitasatospora putterlickiae]|uniref:PAS domain-containing protein n=1 Tax=Kitasatospora putterlickiae TaxID=221725 RepID=UPI0031E1E9C4